MSYTELLSYWKDNKAKLITTYPKNDKCGLTFSVVVDKENIVNFCEKLLKENWFLEAVDGADFKEGFLLSYFFASFTTPGRICFRVLLENKLKASVPSIANLFQGAEWHERETFDFYGINFLNNPNLVPLLLDQNHQGLPPLLKTEKNIASLADIDFFKGDIEFFDDFWKNLKPSEEVKEEEKAEA